MSKPRALTEKGKRIRAFLDLADARVRSVTDPSAVVALEAILDAFDSLMADNEPCTVEAP